jgi:nicotinate phosphoribosyltransferase
MEEKLDLIAEKKAIWNVVLKEFYGPFIEEVHAVMKTAQKVKIETNIVCPNCGKPMLVKSGRNGSQFLVCAGYPDCKICVSNSLDEHLIRDMIFQGAKVDSYGVGERLITASSEAVFGGVYKLAATEENGVVTPKIKISENTAKITIPGVKIPWRLFDQETGKAIADVITLNTERIDDTAPYEIFDPVYTWKRKTVTNFTAKKLQVRIFDKGRQVYTSPTVKEIAEFRAAQVDTLWDEVTRFEKPHNYYIDISEELWNQRNELLNRFNKGDKSCKR